MTLKYIWRSFQPRLSFPRPFQLSLACFRVARSPSNSWASCLHTGYIRNNWKTGYYRLTWIQFTPVWVFFGASPLLVIPTSIHTLLLHLPAAASTRCITRRNMSRLFHIPSYTALHFQEVLQFIGRRKLLLECPLLFGNCNIIQVQQFTPA